MKANTRHAAAESVDLDAANLGDLVVADLELTHAVRLYNKSAPALRRNSVAADAI